jgi:hypothetical protein
MRLTACFCFFLAVAAISFAQNTDTNFSTGPQYLINQNSPYLNQNSPYLLQSIATPTLSLLTPRITTPNAPAEEHSGEPDTAAFGELQNQGQIDRVYWGVNPNGTPAPVPPENLQNSTQAATAPTSSGIFNAGVTRIATAESLREHGYGASLGQIAAYWKAHKLHATRVYTNADITSFHNQQTTTH